ncbi:MAG TPA: site-specific integrase [Pirellulales bacterium]
MSKDSVIRLLSEIGKKAGVVVDKQRGKYASAHDLRRSFGERWASRIMPQQLMELMRHETIETTMRYYVGRNAQSTAAVLWDAHSRATGNTFGNTAQKSSVSTGD